MVTPMAKTVLAIGYAQHRGKLNRPNKMRCGLVRGLYSGPTGPPAEVFMTAVNQFALQLPMELQRTPTSIQRAGLWRNLSVPYLHRRGVRPKLSEAGASDSQGSQHFRWQIQCAHKFVGNPMRLCMRKSQDNRLSKNLVPDSKLLS